MKHSKNEEKKKRIIKIVLDYTLHTCGMWCLVFEYVFSHHFTVGEAEEEVEEKKINCKSDAAEGICTVI